MHSLGCKTIEDGIITASIFFVTGLLIICAGVWIVPEIWYLSHIIIFSGALLLMLVPVVLVATYLKNS